MSTEDEWSWEDWTLALESYFFCPDEPQRPTYFCVDRFALSEITGLPEEEAVRVFTESVRRRVGLGHDYSSVWRECEAWEQTDRADAPPSLPLLGITVLAAARMGKDDGINPQNYYRPLRRLIDPADDERGAPGDYVQLISCMWRQLDSWMKAEPVRGKSSIQAHPTLTHIGYALGQALIRSGDRRQLGKFFRWLQIDKDAGDQPPASEMRRYLRIWARNRIESSSRRLYRLADNDEFRDQCEEVLRESLEDWDPSQDHVTAEGRRVGKIRLAMKETSEPRLGFIATRPSGFPSGQTWSAGAQEATVVLREVFQLEAWYQPNRQVPGDRDGILLPSVDLQEALSDGYTLSSESHTLTFDASRIYALQHDAEIGRKVSVDRIELGAVYDLLVAGDQRQAVQDFIDGEQLLAVLDPGLTLNGDTTWFVFRDFRLDARAKYSPPPELAQLIGGGGGPRLRLVGGLPLLPGRRTYLYGGAPNLAIPPEHPDRHFELTFEQQGTTHRFEAQQADGEYPLSDLNLEAGSYRVAYEDLSIDFEILEGLTELRHQAAGAMSTVGVGGRACGYRVAPGEAGDVPQPAPPKTIRAPQPAERAAYLGTGPGQFEHPRPPKWLKEFAPELTWAMLELDADFEPVWLITTQGRGFTATPINHHPPDEGVQPGNTVWHRCIARSTLVPEASEATRELWERYRTAAVRP